MGSGDAPNGGLYRRSGGRWALGDDPAYGVPPDIGRRLAWILLCHRLHGHPAYADPARFAAALGDAGHPATAEDVTTWEAGVRAPPYTAVEAWELVCGLAPRSLTSLTGYLHGMFSDLGEGAAGAVDEQGRVITVPRVAPLIDPDEPASRDRLDYLLWRCVAGELRGGQWQELGWRIEAAGGVPAGYDLDGVADRLMADLARSLRLSFREIGAAISALSGIEAFREPLVRHAATFLDDPDVQVIFPAVGVLESLPGREASELSLRLLESPPSRMVYHSAIWLNARKVTRGHYTEAERSRLMVAVLAHWRDGPVQAESDLAELLAVLPKGLSETLTRDADGRGRRRFGYMLRHGESASTGRAAGLSAALVRPVLARTVVSDAYAANPMLERLVRETLFHRDTQRRVTSAVLLACSPYASALADQMFTLLGTGGASENLRSRAAQQLPYLVGTEHRLRLHQVVDDASTRVAVHGVTSLAHLPATDTTDLLLRRGMPTEQTRMGRARFYALGLTGSPGLRAIVRERTSPAWQRRAAQWWLRTGSALT